MGQWQRHPATPPVARPHLTLRRRLEQLGRTDDPITWYPPDTGLVGPFACCRRQGRRSTRARHPHPPPAEPTTPNARRWEGAGQATKDHPLTDRTSLRTVGCRQLVRGQSSRANDTVPMRHRPRFDRQGRRVRGSCSNEARRHPSMGVAARPRSDAATRESLVSASLTRRGRACRRPRQTCRRRPRQTRRRRPRR